jgi:predicted metal-binding membrane protein
VAAVAIVIVWVGLFATMGLGLRSAANHTAAMASMPGMSNMPAMAGMAMSSSKIDVWSSLMTELPYWLIMTVAMMGPVALAGIRHTGLHSLNWRRNRAMAEFALSYLALWMVFGAVALTAVVLEPALEGWRALTVVLVTAATWQLTPLKQRLLRKCHRSRPLPGRGWRAEWGALAFGLYNGLPCIGTCWCLMLIMVVAPEGQLLWMLALTAIATGERVVKRPKRANRLVATGLGLVATGVLALALA